MVKGVGDRAPTLPGIIRGPSNSMVPHWRPPTARLLIEVALDPGYVRAHEAILTTTKPSIPPASGLFFTRTSFSLSSNCSTFPPLSYLLYLPMNCEWLIVPH